MAELTTLARPYAKAAFEHALAADNLQAWSDMLSLVAAVAQQDGISRVLGSPALTSQQKGDSFAAVCGDQLDEKAQNFVRVLASNQRLALLPDIRELFELMKANQEKSIDVEVATAFPLSGDLENKLAEALSAKLDRTVKVQSKVDNTLLGGALIRAGDTLIDGSVRGRLAKLAEAMNS